MSYFLKLPVDLKDAAMLENKRRVLAERGKKIFDPILSQQAYDATEIKNQIAERKILDKAEKIRDRTFDQAAHRLDTVQQMIAQKQADAQKSRAVELQEYRDHFQRKELSATFDLNDPDALKKARPIGENGDYSTYGPSSVLTFESDKIRQPQDLKNNILKQRDDLARQMDEQQVKKDYRRHLDNLAHQENAAQCAKLEDLEQVSQELQKAMKLANKDFNQVLAANQNDAKLRTVQQDERDRKAHVNNTINSNFLNERPNNKRDHKGITPDAQQKIYECWAHQKHDIENARNQERAENCTWDNYFRSVGNDYSGQMKALKEERAKMRTKMDEMNRKQVTERTERDDIANTVYSCADPTEAFFDQFQRDPR